MNGVVAGAGATADYESRLDKPFRTNPMGANSRSSPVRSRGASRRFAADGHRAGRAVYAIRSGAHDQVRRGASMHLVRGRGTNHDTVAPTNRGFRFFVTRPGRSFRPRYGTRAAQRIGEPCPSCHCSRSHARRYDFRYQASIENWLNRSSCGSSPCSRAHDAWEHLPRGKR